LSISHIYRMYTDYMGWTMDFTGPQMLLTLKLTTFAFDYHDGQIQRIKIPHHDMALSKFPSLLEFYGFVYFFCGFLAGPAFNMKEYLDFIDGTLFKDAPKGKMPSPFLAMAKKLGATLLIAVGVIMNGKYSLYYARQEEFYAHTLLYKCGYLWLGAFLARFPYYFAWTLSEGSCILAGIGFTGYKDGKAVWDRATNCKVLQLETAQNFRAITEAWNIRTDRWLKHYIYERVQWGNPVAITFATSAFWHGFYPGYYLSFMTAALITQNARLIRRNLRSRFVEADGVTPKAGKQIYDLVSTVVSSWTLNYTMTPFMLLGWDYSVKAWATVFFAGHLANIAVYAALTILGAPRIKKRVE